MKQLMNFTEIVKLYAEFFSIHIVETLKTIDLCVENEIIGRLNFDDPTVFEYKQKHRWNKCKTTDLMTLIVHSCPLHGE